LDEGATGSVKMKLGKTSQARCGCLSHGEVLNTIATFLCVCFVFCALMSAQNPDDAPSSAIVHSGWNFGGQLSDGSTVVQVSAPTFTTANRSISNIAVFLHAGRVLTSEHGHGWTRGTFEWDFGIIPLESFWVLGNHYAGDFEALGPLWNFTDRHRRAVPFVGLNGGMLFSPRYFPPGDTARFNFTVGWDAGTQVFLRPRRSLDLGMRVQHISNAFLGHLNPGVPVSLQLTLGYSWYRLRPN